MTAEPRDELHRLVDEIVMPPVWREALRAAVAAADRENAELRGEVERLRRRLFPGQGESYANEVERQRVVIDTMRDAIASRTAERDDLRAQLAAAQAQLAEFDRECYERSLEQQDALARLEAVRAAMNHPDVRCLCGHESRLHAADRERRCTETADRASWHCPCRTFRPTSIPTSLLVAALSAAPQPEPEVANEQHLHDAEQWLRERVEAAEERMGVRPVECEHGFSGAHARLCDCGAIDRPHAVRCPGGTR